MKRTIPILALIAIAFLIGCANTPAKRWGQARVALTSVQNGLIDAHAGGLIDDEDLVATDPPIQGARAALAAAKSQLPDGGDTFEHYLELALTAILEAERVRLAAEGQE